MDSKNIIDVGVTSSLIELKAEVLRKQQELKASARPTSAQNLFGVRKTAKKLSKVVQNPGVDKRIEKDKEVGTEGEKSYDRAKYVLQEKAKLYDRLNRRETLGYDDKEHPVLSQSLVDFQRKVIDRIQEDPNFTHEPPSRYEEDPEDNYEVDDKEWTEFIDSLGRTRRCLKSDLPKFIERDEEMTKIAKGEPEISEEDQGRIRKHEEWEKQTEEAANKSHVHYQDILYDEIRSHGVGYYQFSKDDQTRQEQLRNLKKMTELTTSERARVKQERKDKKQQLKERLKKIRQRKRAKLGLQAEENNDDEKEKESSSSEEEKEGTTKDQREKEDEKTKSIKKPRAWDFGKPGVNPKAINMDELDEKWMKDRRSERKHEFAPPSLYSQTGNMRGRPSSGAASSSANKYQNFVKGATLGPSTSTSHPSKQERQYQPLESNKHSHQPSKRIADELPAPSDESAADWKRGRRAEIAPPATFEYYHGETKKPKGSKRIDEEAITEAVMMGLRNLKKSSGM